MPSIQPLPALKPGPRHAYNELIEQLPSRAMLVATIDLFSFGSCIAR